MTCFGCIKKYRNIRSLIKFACCLLCLQIPLGAIAQTGPQVVLDPDTFSGLGNTSPRAYAMNSESRFGSKKDRHSSNLEEVIYVH